MLLRSVIFAFAALLYVMLNASPGHATTLYVASNGVAAPPCSATAPCDTFAVAMGSAAVGDTIACLSPPKESGALINKSITIDCSGIRAQIRDNGIIEMHGPLTGIIVNIPVSAGDPRRTVRLRGLTIDGSGITEANGVVFDRGIDIESAAAVYIEDCVVSNVRLQGIFDHRAGGQTKLFIKDTAISGNGGGGIVTASQAVGITVLDNVTSENNAYGIAAGTGNNVEINRSVFSGNSSAGVEGDAGSHVTVSNSTISHNNIGVQSASSVRIYKDSISFNNTVFSGVVVTLGLNSYSSNVSTGTAPMTITGAPADIGP